MDTEEKKLQELMEKAMSQLLGYEPKEFADTLNEIKGWGADEGRFKQAEDAIKQLEEQQKTLLTDLEQKVAAAHRKAFNSQGQYRGSFASEDQAREFALNCIRLTAGVDAPEMAKRSAQALECEHKEFYGRVKDVTGDDALIPHEHSSRVHRLVEDYGVFPRVAFPMPMSSDTLSFTRRASGFRARKLKMRKAGTYADMGVSSINLTADKFYILTSYPIELDEDALIAIAELLVQEMGLGFAIALDEDGFSGDGTSDYDNEKGIRQLLEDINGVDDGGGLVRATGTASGHWAKFQQKDFFKMIGQARHVRPGQGRFYGSQEFFWQVMAPIIASAGGRTMMETAQGLRMNFFGVQYEIVHAMPRTEAADQIPVLYGDIYQAATLGNRRAMTVRRSEDALFTSEQIAVMATERYAFNIHDLGDDTTAGPVVGGVTQ